MATTFERTLGKIILGALTTLFGYLVAVGIYTLIYGNSFFYSFGYSIGYISAKISSLF